MGHLHRKTMELQPHCASLHLKLTLIHTRGLYTSSCGWHNARKLSGGGGDTRHMPRALHLSLLLRSQQYLVRMGGERV